MRCHNKSPHNSFRSLLISQHLVKSRKTLLKRDGTQTGDPQAHMGAFKVYELTIVFIGPSYCVETHREERRLKDSKDLNRRRWTKF